MALNHVTCSGAMERGDLSNSFAEASEHCLAEEIHELWQSGQTGGSFKEYDVQAQKHQILKLRFWICCMVVTGGGVDYLVGLFDQVGDRRGYGGEAAVFVVTAFSFLATAIPPSLMADTWSNIAAAQRANANFKFKILVPSLADLVITSMRFAAVLFISPSVVSMLKTSSQLITLTLIQHCRGKRVNCKSCLCLMFCFLGEILVTFSEMLRDDGKNTGPDGASPTHMFSGIDVGLLMAIASGMLGAVRNVVEEIMLQEDDLSANALLASESWISLCGLVLAKPAWEAFQGTFSEFWGEVANVMIVPTTVPLLILIMLCTYGKDFGKLFVVKHGSALIAKVLSMLFPIVTWVLMISTFLVTDGAYGEKLGWPSSAVRLAGFAVIAVASTLFVVMQTKKK